MLKIRNRETEIADLHRDVWYVHPAWVHEQCGTSSEPELQDLLDQCSDDKFARRAELGDDAGIFMDMETAKAYFTTVAEREAAAPDFCRANFLDASALVKLHVVEEGAAIIRAYFDREPTSYTTPFCFYEALTLLKVKWLYRKEITKEQYLYAASGLSAWYGAVSRDIKDLDFTLPKTFADARRIAERTSLDLSDAFQILSVKAGYYSGLARESATILVTADQPLAKAAKAEGLCRVWYFMKEPAP